MKERKRQTGGGAKRKCEIKSMQRECERAYEQETVSRKKGRVIMREADRQKAYRE